ncbi:hypothetical protein H6G96_37640 [Nostoc sp. FACHB-892]|uniref:hypothetical protein n=1 Tax=Nostoc sp. FACHB-892 TaxID=2692843 RepID=UPI001686AEEF|nr:hypothetical protein [Nostoc sp. FACHB-892]
MGIAAEYNGLTRADYLEQIVQDNTLPSITREKEHFQPCIAPDEGDQKRSTTLLPQLQALETLRDGVPARWKRSHFVGTELR